MHAVANARPRAPPFIDPLGYARHRPETTLLYQLVELHYAAFCELRAGIGRPLPDYVEEEFEAYLRTRWKPASMEQIMWATRRGGLEAWCHVDK
jgi:hypothetical protein